MARAMKDSGIPWIGEIPEKWELRKGKFLFTQRNEKGNSIEVQLLSPTQKYGVIPQSQYEKLSGMKAVKLDENTDFTQMKSIYAGDFCISLRSFQGGFEYSLYNGVVSPAYQVFHKNCEIHDMYYRYLFKDHGFISQMASLTRTFRDGKSIAFDDFANSLIPLPSLSEQVQIANFLDVECARIDAVIEQTRASIEEYKKLKQAVITQAVTKGIRPNRPMKDSGIEWIGEIQSNYRIYRMKHLITEPLMYGANESGIPYEYNLPRYIRITDITMDGKLKDSGKLSLPEDLAKEYLLDDGDVLFARSGATVGKAFIYKKEYGRSAFAGYLIRAKFNGLIIPELFFYYTQSSIYEEWKKQIFIQSTIQNIGADRYNQMPIVVPPIEEQHEILSNIQRKANEIDRLLQDKERLINNLENYKKTLIFEYVTGKKETFKHEEA